MLDLSYDLWYAECSLLVQRYSTANVQLSDNCSIFDWSCSYLIDHVHIWLIMFIFDWSCSYLIDHVHLWLTMFIFDWPCSYLIDHVQIWLTMFIFDWPCLYFIDHVHIWLTMFIFDWPCSYLIDHVHIWLTMFYFTTSETHQHKMVLFYGHTIFVQACNSFHAYCKQVIYPVTVKRHCAYRIDECTCNVK